MVVKVLMLIVVLIEDDEVLGVGLLIYFGEGDGFKKIGDVIL